MPYVFAPSEGYISKVESSFREEICLNGRWDFQPVALPANYQRGKSSAPELPLPDAKTWEAVKIKIPSPILWKITCSSRNTLRGKKIAEMLIDDKGFVKTENLFERRTGNRTEYSFWLWSPRPLDDLLIEPDMPKLDLMVNPAGCEIRIGRSTVEKTDGVCRALPLKQGWNRTTVSVSNREKSDLSLQFRCENQPEFVKQLKTDFNNPDE